MEKYNIKELEEKLKEMHICEGDTVIIDGYELEFDKNTSEYKITVNHDVTSLDISALAEDSRSRVEITGNGDFKEGENTVTITVTAQNGSTRIYTVNVNRKELTPIVVDVNGTNYNAHDYIGHIEKKFDEIIEFVEENIISTNPSDVSDSNGDNLVGGYILLTDSTTNTNISGTTMFIDNIKPEFTYEYSNTTIVGGNTETVTIVFDVTDKYFASTTLATDASTLFCAIISEMSSPCNSGKSLNAIMTDSLQSDSIGFVGKPASLIDLI